MIIGPREDPRLRTVVAGVPLLAGLVCWAIALVPGIQRAGDRGQATPERGWGDLHPYLVPGWVITLLVAGSLAVVLVGASVVSGALRRPLPGPAGLAIVLAGAVAAALGWFTARQDIATDAGFYAFAGMLATFVAACVAALPFLVRRASWPIGGALAGGLVVAAVLTLVLLPAVWQARGTSSTTAAHGPPARAVGVPTAAAWRSSGDLVGVYAGRPIVSRTTGSAGHCRVQVEGLDPLSGRVAWRWSHDANYCSLGPAAGGNDRALRLATFDVSLDPATGRVLHPTDDHLRHVLGYLSSDAVTVERRGASVTMRGVDPATGRVRWQRRAPSCPAVEHSFAPPTRPAPQLSQVADAGSRAVATYVCPAPAKSSNDQVAAVDFLQRTVRVWSIDRGGSSSGDHVTTLPGTVRLTTRQADDDDPDVSYDTTLRYVDGTAYVGYEPSTDRLAALDPSSGAPRWNASGAGAPLAVAGGRVIVGTDEPYRYATVDAATGRDRKPYPGPGPDAVAGGFGYSRVPRSLDRFVVFDLASGRARRTFASGMPGAVGVSLAAGSVIVSGRNTVSGWR